MSSIYSRSVDPDAPNDANAFAIRLTGYNKDVLEFGCAAGHVSKVLTERACRVTALERDGDAAEAARAFAMDVLRVDLDADDFAEKLAGSQFDVALFGDVLEHLRDPLAVLRSVRSLLRPNGFVVISVPNVAHVDVRLALLGGSFDYRPWGLLDETHLRFFTRATVDRLLQQSGFIALETHRVIVPAFETELGVTEDAVDPATLARVLADPEAETYQFVVKAVMDSGDVAVQGLSQRCQELEDRLHQAQIQVGTTLADAERRIDAAERRIDAAEHAAREAEDRIDAAEHAAREAGAELQLMRQTRVFRYTAPARRLYRQLILRRAH